MNTNELMNPLYPHGQILSMACKSYSVAFYLFCHVHATLLNNLTDCITDTARSFPLQMMMI